MEKYCKKCGSVFNDLKFKLCPYCGGKLDTRYGRQPIPRKLRHEVFKRDGYRCRECGSSKDETSLEIDHIVPVAKGGTNDIDNLQTLCRECNRMKHTDEWVGGEKDLKIAQNELNNLKEQLKRAKLKLKNAKTEDDELDYKFNIIKLKEAISSVQENIDGLILKEAQLNNEKRKNKLFKKIYVECDENCLLKICDYFSIEYESKDKTIKYLIDNFQIDEVNSVVNHVIIEEEFEKLNTTTQSVYDLEDKKVLIILKDGTNLTNWDDVENTDDILFISENLTDETDLCRKYAGLENLKGIIISGVTNNVTSIDSMFMGCESLVDIFSLKDWDVSNITNMSYVFAYCESLVDIFSLKDWNVSNVKCVGEMFYNCSSLISLSALKDWDVSNVTSFGEIFGECSNLEDISALNNWNIHNEPYVSMMVDERLLLDLFEILNRTTDSIFDLEDNNVLIILDDGTNLTNWDDVENTDDILFISENLTDETNVESRYSTLKNVKIIISYNLTDMVDNTSYMFTGCNSLIKLYGLDNWDMSNVNNMECMFLSCENLKDISSLSNWDTSKVKNMGGMFYNCCSLKDISPLGDWNVGNVEKINRIVDIGEMKIHQSMFEKCKSLVDASVLSSWDLSHVKNSNRMFYECSNLKKYPSWYKGTRYNN